MVTSPCEWKILEWDDKPQTNKHLYHYSIHVLARACAVSQQLKMKPTRHSPLVSISYAGDVTSLTIGIRQLHKQLVNMTLFNAYVPIIFTHVLSTDQIFNGKRVIRDCPVLSSLMTIYGHWGPILHVDPHRTQWQLYIGVNSWTLVPTSVLQQFPQYSISSCQCKYKTKAAFSWTASVTSCMLGLNRHCVTFCTNTPTPELYWKVSPVSIQNLRIQAVLLNGWSQVQRTHFFPCGRTFNLTIFWVSFTPCDGGDGA